MRHFAVRARDGAYSLPVGTHSAAEAENLPDSPYARELDSRFPRLGFAPPIEKEFAASHLRRARGRVRAWHTTVLAVLLASVLPALLAVQDGVSDGLLAGAWDSAFGDLLLIIAITSTVSRAILAIAAWGPWFERVYPHIAFPLAAICHCSWTFMCSGEILGAHPEYLAALVTDTFAIYFFTGLVFRQALIVNLLAAVGLLLGGWYHAGLLAPILFFAMHFLTNIVMSAIAGFAHERSSRSQFLEHSLLREMAALDGLTGLKNRRAFEEHLVRIWQQSLREARAIAILMIDVDEFKHYNDYYGHQAGDRALRRIADVVRNAPRRPLDMGARYGGEELVVVLYDPAREDVVAIAENVHRSVQSLAIAHEGSSTGSVTVSVGVAIVRPQAGRSPQGAVQLADQALYDAKRDGRNGVKVLEHEYDLLSTGVFRKVASVA